MTGERPRYRALERIFVKPIGWAAAREVEEGEQFAYDGPANTGMLALNGPARAAKLASMPPWRSNPYPAQVHRLARSLGFVGDNGAEARAHIEKFEKENSL